MDKLLMPYVWDLSGSTTKQVKKTEIGNMIHIAESMTPAVFQNKENVFLFVFSSEKAIPPKYIKEYAIVEVTVQQILIEFRAIENILGKTPFLMVNPFDDESVIFTKEQLKEIL
ncbi:MAG: SseB family protein [Clostridia bacterium]|nr:SseB family protein [Clostridia bacterium]